MHSLVLTAFLAVANILGVGMIVPQVRRLADPRRSAQGVSGAWVGVGLALNGWWLAYAARNDLLGLVPVSLGAALLYLAMAVLLVRQDGRRAIRGLVSGVIGLGSLPLPFLLLDGWAAAGLAVGGAYGLQFAPAAVTAVRAADVSGIAPTTWIMALIEAAIWCGYGATTSDGALMIGGAGASAASAVVLARLLKPGRPGEGLGSAPYGTSTASMT